MMRKSVFITLLCFLLINGTVFGQTSNTPAIKIETPQIVAEVNGDKITRSNLADECLLLYGENELHDLINKTLIRLECDRQKIVITAEEINAEILRVAQTFGISSEQWLQALEQQRNISPEQYRQDVIWRKAALAKLAAPRLARLMPSEAELQKEFDTQYGPAVQVRQIVLTKKAEAEAVLAEVKQYPQTFAAVAKNRSIDPVTQPCGGMLRPIRRHTLENPDVEKMLFAMKPGEISPIIEMFAGQFVIFKCESHYESADVDRETERQRLALKIREEKLPEIAAEVFVELQQQAKILIVLGNPALYKQYPGVAALLNGQVIPQKELAEVCVQKYGKEILNDMMNRLLVEQACRREKITISEQDIDKEIWEMAFKHLPLNPDGSANITQWLKRTTEETGLSIPMYRKNVVVPVLSLKRLTKKHVVVTPDDVQRSFEANYGRKVRCLAIYFNEGDMRRAQEVWHKANQHKTEENFGDLAERYSFDPHSRLGKGVIPPIARHCGQPDVENAAFALQPNELSEIIQVEDHLVILYCLGSVEPLPVKIEAVQADLISDIFEKKQQMIIARYFEKLYEQASFDNYLTGESKNPTLERAVREGAGQVR